jgi:hypothetical protein
VILHSYVEYYPRFWGTFCLHLQGRKTKPSKQAAKQRDKLLPIRLILELCETVRSTAHSVKFYRTTGRLSKERRNVPKRYSLLTTFTEHFWLTNPHNIVVSLYQFICPFRRQAISLTEWIYSGDNTTFLAGSYKFSLLNNPNLYACFEWPRYSPFWITFTRKVVA